MNYSIIIPCFNEVDHIGHCLKSIQELEYDKTKIEVIVVDNGSTDGSDSISKRLSDIFISAPNINVGEVRNQGVKASSGNWIIFIDADCSLDKNWLNRADNLIKSCNSENTAFGGGCILPHQTTWVERCWLLEGASGNTLPKALLGCSILIKKSLFESVNGFDSKLEAGEDSAFTERLLSIGARVQITRDLNVTHLGNAKNLSDFLKRQIWHGSLYRKDLKRNLKDPIFFLALTYPLLLALSIITLKLSTTVSFFAFITWVFTPCILTAKRHLRAKKPPSLRQLPLAYILDSTYLFGRALALIVKTTR